MLGFKFQVSRIEGFKFIKPNFEGWRVLNS
jgi:hypothetical protein